MKRKLTKSTTDILKKLIELAEDGVVRKSASFFILNLGFKKETVRVALRTLRREGYISQDFETRFDSESNRKIPNSRVITLNFEKIKELEEIDKN